MNLKEHNKCILVLNDDNLRCKTGNKFKNTIDKKLSAIYSPCSEQELEQGLELINFIEDKLDEAWKFYQEKAERGKI